MKKLTSYFLVLCCAFSAVYLTFSFLFYWNLKEERIARYLKENDLAFLFQNTDGKDSNLLEDTKEALRIIGIPSSTIHEVVNSDVTTKFIAKYLRELSLYFIYKTEEPSISKQDMISLVEENFSVVNEVLQREGKSLSEDQKKIILTLIDHHSDHIMELFPTVVRFQEKIRNEDLSIYQNVGIQDVRGMFQRFSNKTLVFSLILILISSSFLLFLIYRKKFFLFCKYLSFSIFLYVSFFVSFEVFLGTVLKEYLMLEWQSANTILNYLVNVISKDLWIFLLLSLGLLLFFGFFRKKLEIKEKSVIIVEQEKGKENICLE